MKSSLMKQMFIVSDCLLKLGYINLAKLAQRAENWEFVYDFISVIKQEATVRQDSEILNRIARAGMTRRLA